MYRYLTNILLVLVFVSLTFKYQLRMPGAGYWATVANLMIVLYVFFMVMVGFRTRFRRYATRLDTPFALFSIAIFISLIYGLLQEGFSQQLLSDFRQFLPYLLFFLVTMNRDIYSKPEIMMSRIVFIVLLSALIVSVYCIAGSILHFTHPLDSANPWEMRQMQYSGMLRTSGIVPHMSLAIAPLVLLSIYMTRRMSRLFLQIVLFLSLLGLFTSFTRTLWGFVVISLAIAFVLIHTRLGKNVRIMLVAGVALILIHLFLSMALDVSALEVLSQRFGVFSRSTIVSSGSMGHRVGESMAYWEMFLDSKFMGAGFGATVSYYSPSFEALVERGNWHNSYTAILGKMGLLGFTAFLFILMRLFRDMIFIYRNPVTESEFINAALLISCVVSLVMSSLVISSFTAATLTPLFIVSCALVGIYAEKKRQALV